MSIKFVREEEVRVYELDRGLARLINLALVSGHKAKVAVIIREMTGFGLQETKDIVDCLEISDYVSIGGTAIVRVVKVARDADAPPSS